MGLIHAIARGALWLGRCVEFALIDLRDAVSDKPRRF